LLSGSSAALLRFGLPSANEFIMRFDPVSDYLYFRNTVADLRKIPQVGREIEKPRHFVGEALFALRFCSGF
jgi:hypothetical protein